MNLKIGSGDVKDLMMGKETKGYVDLWRKFLSNESPRYNALASPIDALRTGAILEFRYLQLLDMDYFTQYSVTSKEMDVMKSSLDFAKISDNKIVDFDELKTMWLTDYLDKIIPLIEVENYIEVIKKKFSGYYNQVQHQLFCSELESCNLVFLSVTSYDDEENYNRVINEGDFAKFRIYRDEKVIEKIKKRCKVFQIVKDNFKN